MKYFFTCMLFLLHAFFAYSQLAPDTAMAGKKIITLSEVVIEKNMNVPAFIEKIKNDSSFYKAFRNLHILNFTAVNDVRMLNKDGTLRASLYSKTKQRRSANCRYMDVKDEQVTGDFYTADGGYNYYTAQMYASLFFTKDSVCGENNIVAGREFATAGKSGMEKHKEQLKMLFFNPGKRISGLPFMSNKTAIYEDEMADKYDMSIDYAEHMGKLCYVFRQKVKPGKENGVVVDEMVTWFNEKNYEVVARNYSLSYDAAFYDFKVDMEVQMSAIDGLTVPAVIRYTGNWKAITKKRERGVFTATLSSFSR